MCCIASYGEEGAGRRAGSLLVCPLLFWFHVSLHILVFSEEGYDLEIFFIASLSYNYFDVSSTAARRRGGTPSIGLDGQGFPAKCMVLQGEGNSFAAFLGSPDAPSGIIYRSCRRFSARQKLKSLPQY